MLFKKSKKNIAILLVIAMLLTIMPMTVFAEGEEGVDWIATISPSAVEVTTGSTVKFVVTATTSSTISWNSTGGILTEENIKVDENGVTSSSVKVKFDTVGDYIVTATVNSKKRWRS